MKTKGWLALGSLALLSLAGCASQTTATAQAPASPPADTFTGEVWTWDERENTVTLRRGVQDIRVKTTPDQIRRLQLHQTATIRGQLAPPADLPSTIDINPTLITLALLKPASVAMSFWDFTPASWSTRLMMNF